MTSDVTSGNRFHDVTSDVTSGNRYHDVTGDVPSGNRYNFGAPADTPPAIPVQSSKEDIINKHREMISKHRETSSKVGIGKQTDNTNAKWQVYEIKLIY